jgi:hypothetical protein
MALTLNLEKSARTLVLSLEKAGVTKPPALEVGFGLDVSGSFEDEHRAGITDQLLTRLVPWGLAFDPDRKVDVFTFSSGANGVHDVGSVDARNYDGYVANNIIAKVPGWNGGTDYSHLLERMLKHFGWAGPIEKKAGFFGRLMGQKDEVIPVAKKRSLVIVATDGDNADKERTMRVLRESEQRQDQVYFLFLGISNQGSTFPFLDRIGDQFGNTGFKAIHNLRKFVAQSDEELNEQLIDGELIAWLKG